MLQIELAAQRPYYASIEAESFTEATALEIGRLYLELLEATMNEPAQVVRCFNAWEKEIQSGILSMTRAEINDAADWRKAHVHAYHMATTQVNASGSARIVFRLR